MSTTDVVPGEYEAECLHAESEMVELLIGARPRDLGGFTVRRSLPNSQRRLVGPFIFFDHMGPARLEVGQGMDVRPHPHIALATLTYLFDGEIVHRDSLGSLQPIRPGDVNWMFAGRGIVHSERSSSEARRAGVRLHGIQCWVAVPTEDEESAPTFEHYPAHSVPVLRREGAVLDVIAGTAYGQRSPVSVRSPTLYAHARLEQGATLPIDDEHEERAVYVVEGAIGCDDRVFGAGTMLVLKPRSEVTVQAARPSRVMLLGGAKLSGERHIWWNFVASSPSRIERAKDDWRSGRFPKVPGDELELIPLPLP
jgi:redox-sensitive bicupin YhaK (pirin superfamily)